MKSPWCSLCATAKPQMQPFAFVPSAQFVGAPSTCRPNSLHIQRHARWRHVMRHRAHVPRMSTYGESTGEFEVTGNEKLQEKLVRELMWDIHKIVLADHLDFYVSSEIVKLKENLREMFHESREKIRAKGEIVARLESADALYRWDKLVRDAELECAARSSELQKEHEALDALLNRPQRATKAKRLSMKALMLPGSATGKLHSSRAMQRHLVQLVGSTVATFALTVNFARSVELSIHQHGTGSIAQLGLLCLTVLLVFTASLSMTLPRK